MINEIKSVSTTQYLIAGAQASSSSFKLSYLFQSSDIYRFEKSTHQVTSQIGGIIMFVTKDLINVANAAPNINHTAISIAFHLIRKFLNSFIIIKILKLKALLNIFKFIY
jgi:hypothetical protein